MSGFGVAKMLRLRDRVAQAFSNRFAAITLAPPQFVHPNLTGHLVFRFWGKPKKASEKQSVAVVTMVHNEPDMLPVWLRHYASEVGAENCFVIDHGSDDGSTSDIGCTVSRLVRSLFDDNFRATVVSGYCAALLHMYDTVIYTDCDELIRADPDLAKTLTDFVSSRDMPAVGYVLGMDVLHAEGEPPLNYDTPILAQRRWARPSHALCKPLVIRKSFHWAAGFHNIHAEAEFCGLYMFHIAYADETVTRRRQAKRNAHPPAHGGDHHKISPDAMVDLLRMHTPWGNKVELRLGGCQVERDYVATMAPWSCQPASAIWAIPDRFRLT